MEVISLLQAKGRCLARFLRITREGIADLQDGKFDELSQLERRRDHLVKALRLFDQQITQVASEVSPELRTPELSRKIEAILAEHHLILADIIRADAQITDLIQAQEERIRSELIAANKTRTQVQTHQKFKSQWTPELGGELDRKL